MQSTYTQRATAWRRPDFVPERRKERRYQVRLPFRLSLPQGNDSQTDAAQPAQQVIVMGHTNDIGTEGLALVGPLIRLGYRYLMGKENVLQVWLCLPSGVIKLEATPVRYVQMEPDATGAGFIMTGPAEIASDEAEISCLIGVRITRMSERDRALYLEYIRSLEQAETNSLLATVINQEIPQASMA